MNERPVLLDLCCGLGGWCKPFIAAGWLVVGVDIEARPEYPGLFVRADVRELPFIEGLRPDLIVASPPCQNYTLAKWPRPIPTWADWEIWQACAESGRRSGSPVIIENVRGAWRYHGPSAAVCGSRFLWGDVPALIPFSRRADRKTSVSGTRKNYALLRSKVPYHLGAWLAEVFGPDRGPEGGNRAAGAKTGREDGRRAMLGEVGG